MPANLTQQYLKAEAKYKAAVTPEEKYECLQEMMREIPKHKGTEKMRAELKKKISQLNKELSAPKASKRFSYRIEKQGGGCVTLVGPPNAGKSALINALTNATTEVAEYPFTTREPFQAMMMYEDIPIELVDLPPISTQHTESWLLPLIRVSDLILLVFDLSSDSILDEFDATIEIITQGKIQLVTEPPALEEQDNRIAYIPTILLLNKVDLPESKDNLEIFQEYDKLDLPMMKTSIHAPELLKELTVTVFKKLDILRVYSKVPGHPPDLAKPYILKRGSHLMDFARQVHKDFSEHLNFARVWGSHTFEGQRVDKDYILNDKDVIELHL